VLVLGQVPLVLLHLVHWVLRQGLRALVLQVQLWRPQCQWWLLLLLQV
jgi:hypothetical protein